MGTSKPSPPPPPPPRSLPSSSSSRGKHIRASDLDHGEDAATDNFKAISAQAQQQPQQRPRPQLAQRSNSKSVGNSGSSPPLSSSLNPNVKFKSLARRVLQVKKEQSSRHLLGASGGAASSPHVRNHHHYSRSTSATAAMAVQAMMSNHHRGHRRVPSSAHAMLNFMNEPTKEENSDDDDNEEGDENGPPTNIVMGEAMHGTTADESDKLFMAANLAPQDPNYDDTSTVVSDVSFDNNNNNQVGLMDKEERLPLNDRGYAGGNNNNSGSGDKPALPVYGSLAAGVRQNRVKRKQQRKLFRYLRRCLCDYIFNPAFLCQLIYQNVILHSLVISLALPCFIAAWLLFYNLGNPTFDFLPDGRLSWWLNFVGRQVLVLELSRLTQWLLLDGFVLGTRFSVRLLGPLVTLTAIQAKGWPFLLAAWGAWDMMLLHGDNKFALHWLQWTGWQIYTTQTGLHIISNPVYLRVLVAMVVAGLATTTKRAALAVYFGQRQLVEFKPRLEKLLGDIVLLGDVATLGEEAELVAGESDTLDDTGTGGASEGNQSGGNKRMVDFKNLGGTNSGEMGGLSSLVYTNVHFSGADGVGGSSDAGEERRQQQDDDPYNPPFNKNSGDDSSYFEADKDGGGEAGVREPLFPTSRRDLMKRNYTKDLSRNSSGTFNTKHLLDRWEEPAIKNEKNAQSSTIEDVLRFRRALACMDEEYPFGEAFGSANSRDACIQSANSLYHHLMKLDPTANQLSFQVLALAIAQEEEEEGEDPSDEYIMKKKAFRKLFRPDVRGELPLLAFVQSCDTVYRRLRYFIASVRNSSVIDKALENMFNGFFFFVLTLLLMSVMRLNPWPILVSVTSLLVSISFALGPSVSKFVEGVLLIAARRPYDLGDRIVISDSNSITNPGVAESWFVEDINLWCTTLRYAGTNEVSTINNSAIAASRIVNCNRSPNAIIQFLLITNIAILSGSKFHKFREALERYVKENPRTWEAVAFVRHEEYDADWEKIYIRIACRHRTSWQDAARILQNRGQLQRFVFETGKKMGINFQTPPLRRVWYEGGEYKKPSSAAVADNNALADCQN
ncbi:hypothetical protein ACA910_009701 [Epithemia clementina (nom. ined.)]